MSEDIREDGENQVKKVVCNIIVSYFVVQVMPYKSYVQTQTNYVVLLLGLALKMD